MKKFVLVVVVTLLLGACLPTSFTSNPGTQPAVDIPGTVNAIMGTAVAQTLTSQPTATIAPVTDTPTPTAVLFEASPTPTETATALPAPNLTTTPMTATTVGAKMASSGFARVLRNTSCAGSRCVFAALMIRASEASQRQMLLPKYQTGKWRHCLQEACATTTSVHSPLTCGLLLGR